MQTFCREMQRRLKEFVRAWLADRHYPPHVRRLLRRYRRVSPRLGHDTALELALRTELWLEGADRPQRDPRYHAWREALEAALSDRECG